MGDLRLLFNTTPPLSKEIEMGTLKAQYGEFGDLALASSAMAGTDAVPEVLFDKQIEAEVEYLPELSKTYDKYWVELIMTNDFESAWQEFQKEIAAKGILEIQKERTAYYNEYVKK